MNLYEACQTGNLHMVKYWANRDPKKVDIYWGLYAACQYGKTEIVEYIIDTFPETYKTKDLMKLACNHGYSDIAKILLHLNPVLDESLIFNICKYGYLDILEMLLVPPEIVNGLFRVAACNGQTHICEHLYDNYDVDIRDEDDNALIKSVEYKHLETTKFILDKTSS